MTRKSPLWLGLVVLPALAAQEMTGGKLPSGPLPETTSSGIGYPSVAAALAALKARSDVDISTVRGWTIISDKKSLAVWSFAPESYPAYPAVVKRSVRSSLTGGSDAQTSVLCEATKEACDQLVREFDAMNQRALPHGSSP